MKRSKGTALTASIVLALCAANGTLAVAQTANPAAKPSAKAAPQDSGASMVKPPESASGSGGSSNPDNMPIKRPATPTNDRMSHEPPASGANAK